MPDRPICYLLAAAAFLLVACNNHLAEDVHDIWSVAAVPHLADNNVRTLNKRALTAEEKAQNEHWAELGGAIIKGSVDATMRKEKVNR